MRLCRSLPGLNMDEWKKIINLEFLELSIVLELGPRDKGQNMMIERDREMLCEKCTRRNWCRAIF